MIRGPLEYVPPVEVEVATKRKAIPLDENEGIYVRDIKTGKVRKYKIFSRIRVKLCPSLHLLEPMLIIGEYRPMVILFHCKFESVWFCSLSVSSGSCSVWSHVHADSG